MKVRPIYPNPGIQGDDEYSKPTVDAEASDQNEVALTIADVADWTGEGKPKPVTIWLDPLDAAVLGEQLAQAARAAYAPKKRKAE